MGQASEPGRGFRIGRQARLLRADATRRPLSPAQKRAETGHEARSCLIAAGSTEEPVARGDGPVEVDTQFHGGHGEFVVLGVTSDETIDGVVKGAIRECGNAEGVLQGIFEAPGISQSAPRIDIRFARSRRLEEAPIAVASFHAVPYGRNRPTQGQDLLASVTERCGWGRLLEWGGGPA